MKIILVQVGDEFDKNLYLPYAISSVWSYAITNKKVSENWQVEDVIMSKIDIGTYVDKMPEVDIVAFSVYIWNNEYCKNFAVKLKEKFPNIKIIVGGPQIPRKDPHFFENHPMFDIAVLGEGELCFEKILANWPNTIQDSNVFYKGGKLPDGVVRVQYLDKLVSPIANGFYDWIMKNEMEKRPRKEVLWNIAYETMRGCPYHCSFCEIGASYFNKVKMFDIGTVYKDIDWIAENKIEFVQVVDSNWGMFERDLDITKYVIDKKLQTGYPKVWNVTWAKNNSERLFEISLLDRKAKTNLFKGVTFAYQSMTEETLKAIDRFNLDETKIKYFLDMYQKYDIPTYSEIIWPLPMETVESLKETVERIVDLGQNDWLQANHLQLLPNVPMADPKVIEQYKIEVKPTRAGTDWHKISKGQEQNTEKQYTVISTSTANFEQVIEGLMFLWSFVNLYYYGWFYYGIKYLKKKKGLKAKDVVDVFMSYCMEKKNFIYDEYKLTKQMYKDTLMGKIYSGRQIFGDDDLYWELKSATSIIFYKNKDDVYRIFKDFLVEEYGVPEEKSDAICELNREIHYDHNKTYPYTARLNREIVKDCLDIDASTVEIDHWDNKKKYDNLFDAVQSLFHFQRKNRYWKCQVSSVNP